jgi:ATP-dependent Clp protease, protease subunit
VGVSAPPQVTDGVVSVSVVVMLPFAVAARRIAHPHATFRLVEPELDVRGRTTDVLADADRHVRLMADLHERLAAATGQPAESIAADFSARRLLTSLEAREYGLVDAIATARGPRPVR